MTSGRPPNVRGQSTVVGLSLLVVITVVGSGLVVGLGSTALTDLQDSTDLERAEHAMTLLDSRTAMAALGESQSQQVDFGRSARGTYAVRDGGGWIRIEHLNYSATDPPENETIYNRTLGTFTYESGDTTLAYEGGGVWRERDGNTTMVSPPEFHYRDATLTLPVIQVSGDSGVSGGATASVRPSKTVERIYPNPNPDSPDAAGPGAPYGDDTRYNNPVRNGTVRITVKSEYYQGWASFFETRTEGNVTVDHARDLATVELETVGGTNGPFEMPSHGNAVNVRTMDPGHPIDTFEITLQDSGNSNFYKHMYWSWYAQNGNDRYEILIYSPDKQQCNNNKFADLTVSVFYTNGTVTHEWENSSVPYDSGDIRVVCSDLDGDGKDEPRIDADLTGNTVLHYQDVSTPADKWHFDPSSTSDPQATWDEHDSIAAESGAGTTYIKGSGSESLDGITNHYLSLTGPNIDLRVSETSPSGARVDETESYGTIIYDQGRADGFLTYLHITENEVEVNLR